MAYGAAEFSQKSRETLLQELEHSDYAKYSHRVVPNPVGDVILGSGEIYSVREVLSDGELAQVYVEHGPNSNLAGFTGLRDDGLKALARILGKPLRLYERGQNQFEYAPTHVTIWA